MKTPKIWWLWWAGWGPCHISRRTSLRLPKLSLPDCAFASGRTWHVMTWHNFRGIYNWYNCDMWPICFFYNCSGEYVTDITVTELPRIFLLTMTTVNTAAPQHTPCRICRCHTPSIGMRRACGCRGCLVHQVEDLVPVVSPTSQPLHLRCQHSEYSECHCRPNSLWKPYLCLQIATWIEQFSNFDDFWTWWKIDDHGESNGNDQERLNYQRATCLKLLKTTPNWFAIRGSQQRRHWSALPRRPFIPCSEAGPNALRINLHTHTYP